MVASFTQIFGNKPSSLMSPPCKKNDHPELDYSDPCDMEEIKEYHSVVGSKNDITAVVMTLLASVHQIYAHERQMLCTKHLFAYLRKLLCDACIYNRAHKPPDYSTIQVPVEYDWTTSINGEAVVLIPSNAPCQSMVEITTYGSEFVVVHICEEQIIDLQNTLWHISQENPRRK